MWSQRMINRFIANWKKLNGLENGHNRAEGCIFHRSFVLVKDVPNSVYDYSTQYRHNVTINTHLLSPV